MAQFTSGARAVLPEDSKLYQPEEAMARLAARVSSGNFNNSKLGGPQYEKDRKILDSLRRYVAHGAPSRKNLCKILKSAAKFIDGKGSNCSYVQEAALFLIADVYTMHPHKTEPLLRQGVGINALISKCGKGLGTNFVKTAACGALQHMAEAGAPAALVKALVAATTKSVPAQTARMKAVDVALRRCTGDDALPAPMLEFVARSLKGETKPLATEALETLSSLGYLDKKRVFRDLSDNRQLQADVFQTMGLGPDGEPVVPRKSSRTHSKKKKKKKKAAPRTPAATKPKGKGKAGTKSKGGGKPVAPSPWRCKAPTREAPTPKGSAFKAFEKEDAAQRERDFKELKDQIEELAKEQAKNTDRSIANEARGKTNEKEVAMLKAAIAQLESSQAKSDSRLLLLLNQVWGDANGKVQGEGGDSLGNCLMRLADHVAVLKERLKVCEQEQQSAVEQRQVAGVSKECSPAPRDVRN